MDTRLENHICSEAPGRVNVKSLALFIYLSFRENEQRIHCGIIIWLEKKADKYDEIQAT